MKADRSSATVVAFLIAKGATRSFNVDTLNRQAMLNELRDTCEAIQQEWGGSFSTASRAAACPGWTSCSTSTPGCG